MPFGTAGKLLVAFLAILLAVAGIAGCGGSGDPGSSGPTKGDVGYLSFKVQWPQPEVNAELIPTGTDRIEITIADEGASEPEATVVIAKTDVTGGTATKRVTVKASAAKTISAQALDTQDRILAEASVTVEVQSGKLTPVSMALSPTTVPYPVVLAVASPEIALPGSSISLVGSATDGDGGTIALYEWDTENDGTFDFSSPTSGTATVTPAEGNYTAVFRATDNDGLSAEASVTYAIGTRPPAWVDYPTSVDFNRRESSEMARLEFTQGFPASPCQIVVLGGQFTWVPEADSTDPNLTVRRGTFAAVDPYYVGTLEVNVVVEDDLGRTSDPATIRFTVRQGFHGFVRDLLAPGVVYPDAHVSFGTTSTTTYDDGEYLVHGVSSDTLRMRVTSPTLLTRSFPVEITPRGEEDVTVLPGNYNTYMLRSFFGTPFGEEQAAAGPFIPGVTARYRPTPESHKCTFVIYTRMLDVDRPVTASMIAVLRGVLVNEFPILTDGQQGGAETVEIFQGQPTDDPRFSADDALDWGGIWDHNALGLSVVESFTDAGVAGLGGWGYDGNYWATGGGVSVIEGAEYPSIWRHELGHAFFCWPHPWSRMLEADFPEFMENSVMNYDTAAAWPSPDGDYTAADKGAIKFAYHRGAGNQTPDYDVDSMVGYRGVGETARGVLYRDPAFWAGDNTRLPSSEFTVQGGQLVYKN
jgi:hypothetical protein